MNVSQLRARMSTNLASATIETNDMLLFLSAPHVAPVPVSVSRIRSRAMAMIDRYRLESGDGNALPFAYRTPEFRDQ